MIKSTKKILNLCITMAIVSTLQMQMSIAQDKSYNQATNSNKPIETNAKVNNASNPNWDDNSQQLFDAMVSTFKINNNNFNDFEKNLELALQSNDEKLSTKVFLASLKIKRYADTLKIVNHWQEISGKRDLNPIKVYALVLNNNIDDAYKIMDNKLNENKFDDKYLDQYFNMLSTSWDNKSVLYLIERFANKYPDSTSIRYYYAELLNWQLENEKAISYIDKFLLKEPKNTKLYKLKSDVYRYSGDIENAKQVWISALTDYPDDLNLQINYANFLFNSYDFTGCLELLEKIKSKSMAETIDNLKFMSLVRLGELDRAEKVYDVNDMSPKEKNRTYVRIASIFMQNKNYKEAEKYWNKVSKEDDDEAITNLVSLSKAEIAYNSSLAEGEVEFAKISDIYKGDETSKLSDRLQLLEKYKYYQQAYDLVSERIKSEPKNPDLYYSRSLISDKLKNSSQSISDLEIALSINPNDYITENALGFMMITGKNKAFDKADLLINSAFVEQPFDAAIVDSKGWYYYQKGDYEKSLKYLHYSYLNYIDGEVVGHYVSALLKSGDVKRAKAIYQLELKNLKDDDKLKLNIEPVANLLNN